MSIDDPTEGVRRVYQQETNALKDDEIPGETWDTKRLQEDFEVLGFMAPFVAVRRKVDGVKGSLRFRHNPRVYFGWQADSR